MIRVVVAVGIGQNIDDDVVAMIADAFHVGEDVDVESGLVFGTGVVVDPVDVGLAVFLRDRVEFDFAFVDLEGADLVLELVGG